MENKSVKFWKIFAVVLIVLNLVLIGFLLLRPLGGRHPEVKEEGAPGNFLVEKLKLTTPQQAQLRKLREDHHAAMIALQTEGRKLRKIFFEGLTSETVNKDADSIANKIAENQKQIELITYSHFEEIKKMCTGEQKIIFNDIILDVLDKISNSPQKGMRRMHPKTNK